MNNKFDKDEVEKSVAVRFESIVKKYPDNIAIKYNNDFITYQQLNNQANQIAELILKKSTKSKPICIFLEQGIQQFIAIIAALKTGNPYVILNSSLPPQRLTYIIEILKTNIAITNNDNYLIAQQKTSPKCILINFSKIDKSLNVNNPNIPILPADLATITFTSGSTGKPKGVKRNQRHLLHRVWLETNEYKITAKENISLLYSASFSASTSDIYVTLLNGATLSIYNLKEKGVYPLTQWLIREKITFLHLPSVFYREWLKTLNVTQKFPFLRRLTLSGRLYREDVEKSRKHLTDETIMIQSLSSSETAKITRLIIDKNTEITSKVVPVGYSVPDKELLLLDENREKVGFNQVGEIAVKSRYLADGYWQNEELTRQKFIPCKDEKGMFIYLSGDLGRIQSDGCLELLGRKDFQVKIRDYTVNLAEVEIALLELVEIKEVAVIAHDYSTQDVRIIAYLVFQNNSSLTVKKLNEILSDKLPEYMIPFGYVFLNYFPVTEVGKIDRQALPIPTLSRSHLHNSYIQPSNFIEKTLVKIWQEVLKIEKIGIEDNFLELGGNSLLATQIVNRIVNQLGVEVSLVNFLNTPTIAKMAETIYLLQSTLVSENELEMMLKDIENLSIGEI